MPASVVKDPLGLTCTFSKGRQRYFSHSLKEQYRCALAEDLLNGLVGLIHPHGRVDSMSLVTDYLRSIRHMVDALGGLTPGGARDLTVPMLSEFWIDHDNRIERHTRALILALEETDDLRTEVRLFAAGRKFNIQAQYEPLNPYTEGEWEALKSWCQRIVDTAYSDHRAAIAELEASEDSADFDPSPTGVLRLLAQIGPATVARVGAQFGLGKAGYAGLNVGAAQTRLFPSVDTAFAYQCLFGVHSGIVPDGIADLGIPTAVPRSVI
jgi:hypothetical protein